MLHFFVKPKPHTFIAPLLRFHGTEENFYSFDPQADRPLGVKLPRRRGFREPPFTLSFITTIENTRQRFTHKLSPHANQRVTCLADFYPTSALETWQATSMARTSDDFTTDCEAIYPGTVYPARLLNFQRLSCPQQSHSPINKTKAHALLMAYGLVAREIRKAEIRLGLCPHCFRPGHMWGACLDLSISRRSSLASYISAIS